MNSKDLALGGILIALTTIILYSTSILPISTISILTVASAIIPICIIRSNVKNAVFVYIASSMLAFFIAPINISVMYILFFGIFGVVKYYIESLDKIVLEYILKLIFFNIVFLIGFIFMQSILGVNLVAGLEVMIANFVDTSIKSTTLILVWVIIQPVFLIYDYAMTMIIDFYMKRIHKNA